MVSRVDTSRVANYSSLLSHSDAQRPKDEEERHERTLESKRRWAKKNRDERKSSEEILEDDLFENESENVDPSDDGNWIDEDVAPKVTRKSQEVHARNAVTKRPSLAESIADDTTEGDLSFESLEGGRDEWRGRGGSAPLRSREAMLKEDEGISRPMLRASMSMGGYVDGNRARSPAGPYPAYQVPSSGHQQYPQYLQRPPNPPPQTYLSHSMYQSQSAQAYYHPQPSRHQQVPEHYTHPPPYYPSQHFVEEVSSPQIFYGITPSNSESALTNNDNRNHHIPQSSSLPNLSNARRAPRTVPPPTTTNTSSTIYYQEPQRHQPVLSQASDSSYEYDTADLISKGLLAQPYRGGATSERDRLMSVQEATRAPVGGGGKEDAACVLMALKKGCSSPSSPRVSHPSLHPRTYYQQPPIPQLQYSIPKSRSPGLDRIKTSSIYGVGVGESSLDEDDGSFSFATSSRRLLVEPDSPPSSTTSDSELRTTNTLASRLPKRAASESPPLSNPRESPKKSRPSNRAVPPTTPGVFNAVLDSSPAVEFDGELVGQDENFEEGATTVEALDYTRGRGGRVRDDSGSPSADVKKGKGRSSIVERGSSPTTTWQARPQATARATKPTSSTRGRAGEMLPPHPGSSSSASSFNLSTPAGPSSHDALSFKSFYASNAAVNSSGGGVMYGAGNLQRDDQYYHSLHLSSAPLPSHRRHHYGQPGSSPPSNGFLFSSPANPGISKQLGLTAQPGPGVYVAIAGETPGKVHGNVQLGRDSAEGGGKRGKVGKEASLMAELLGKEQRLKEIPESEGV